MGIYDTYVYLSEDSNQDFSQETFRGCHESPSKRNIMYQ